MDHSGFAGAKVNVDGAAGLPYRSNEEVQAWMSRDPILRYKNLLLELNLATAGDLQDIEVTVAKQVDDSITYARAGKSPEPSTTALNVYANDRVAATQFFNRQGFAA
jgi:TPP-dependent pyruvate/acetoin dehydrogenase alpha subunit